MKYFKKRRNPLKELSDAELELRFEKIVEYFTLEWLEKNEGNPLQKLWKRFDVVSTNELYILGQSMMEISAIDHQWMKQQVSNAKSPNPNNHKGAMFEIIALSMLNAKPTPANTPGFDGILEVNPPKKVRVSLKNYGDSVHTATFNKHADEVEKVLVPLLKTNNISPIQFVIYASTYPEQNDWDALIAALPEVTSLMMHNEDHFFGINNFWWFMYSDLPKEDDGDFFEEINSYTIMMVSPYHRNEENNLYSKLDDACANLVKHAKTEDTETINMILIHLPDNASIEKCKKWADEYLINFPEKPISVIALYQPTIVSDLEKGTSHIHHCVKISYRENFLVWNRPHPIKFDVKVGTFGGVTPESKLHVTYPDGKVELFDLNNLYTYQKGNLYHKAVVDSNGTITGNPKRVSSGIFIHSVFQLAPNQPPMIFSGIHQPTDKLLII